MGSIPVAHGFSGSIPPVRPAVFHLAAIFFKSYVDWQEFEKSS